MDVIFTDDEIELLKDFQEIMHNSKLNGKEVTCFENAYLLVTHKNSQDKYTHDDLQKCIKQIEEKKEFLISLGFADTFFFYKLILHISSML